MVAIQNFLGSLPLPTKSTLSFLEQARKTRANFSLADVDPDVVLQGPQKKVVVQNFHLEAIRRRCDHDGDHVLSLNEFLEVIKGVQGTQPAVKSETFYSLQPREDGANRTGLVQNEVECEEQALDDEDSQMQRRPQL